MARPRAFSDPVVFTIYKQFAGCGDGRLPTVPFQARVWHPVTNALAYRALSVFLPGIKALSPSSSVAPIDCDVQELYTVNHEIMKDERASQRGASQSSSAHTPSPRIGLGHSKSWQKKFLRHFHQVPAEERILNYYSCALVGEILLQGHLYITRNYFAFHSNVFGYVTKLLIPVSDVEKVTKERTAKIFPNAVGIVTSQDKHVFSSLLSRDATYRLMVGVWKRVHQSREVDADRGSLGGSSADSMSQSNSDLGECQSPSKGFDDVSDLSDSDQPDSAIERSCSPTPDGDRVSFLPSDVSPSMFHSRLHFSLPSPISFRHPSPSKGTLAAASVDEIDTGSVSKSSSSFLASSAAGSLQSTPVNPTAFPSPAAGGGGGRRLWRFSILLILSLVLSAGLLWYRLDGLQHLLQERAQLLAKSDGAEPGATAATDLSGLVQAHLHHLSKVRKALEALSASVSTINSYPSDPSET